MFNHENLKGKVAVVTGGGGVLCAAFAKTLAAQGCKVAVLDLNEGAAQKCADEINANGGEAIAVGCNVLELESMENARKTVNEKLGTCDILLNGAGGNNPKGTTTKDTLEKIDLVQKDENVKTFFDLDPNGISFVFNLNFLGTLIPTQVFAKDMAEKEKGTIIMVTSMNAFRPLTRIPAYSAAKAAVKNFTEWMAVHFAPLGIRVNAIAPGFFSTKQNAALLWNEDGTPTERTGKILAATPMDRFGEPEELAGTLGYALLNGAKKVKLFGEEIEVRASIVNLPGISGHADKNQLTEWLGAIKNKPEHVFIVHGEESTAEYFANHVHETFGYDAVAPYSGDAYDLITNQKVADGSRKLVEKRLHMAWQAERRLYLTVLWQQARGLYLLSRSVRVWLIRT